MRYITTAILLLLTLVMGVYAMVQKSPEPEPDLGVEKRVFDSFEPKEAKAIVWELHDEKIRLEKKDGKWRMVSPIRFPASEDAVGTLLTDLETLIYTRRIEGDAGSAEYKLSDPRIVVRVEGVLPKGKDAVLRIGGLDLTERNVFVATGRSEDVLVVGKHIVESADKKLSEIRDSHALLFDPVKLDRVDVVTQKTTFRVSKKDGAYSLVDERGEELCRAHRETTESVIRRIEDLEITRFVEDGKEALAAHGLTRSGSRITVHAGGERTLFLGGPCVVDEKSYGGEILAGRKGPVPAAFCIKAGQLRKIMIPPKELRAVKLLDLTADSLSKITVRAGEDVLVVENKKEEGWVIRPSEKKKKGAEGREASWSSDAEIVSKYLDDIQAFSALGFAFPREEELADYGLVKPVAEVRFVARDGRTETLELGAETEKYRYVRRKGQKCVAMVHKEIARWFEPKVTAFRDLTVLQLDQLAVERVVTISSEVTEELVKKEGEWKVIKPVEVDGDDQAVRALLRTVSTLEARRYVSEAARPEHGFGSPRSRKIRCVVEKDGDAESPVPPPSDRKAEPDASPADEREPKRETHELEVGGDVPTGRGCFARLLSGDGWVFVLDELACSDLRALLATRQVVDITPAVISRISYVGPKTAEELEKRGPHWYRKAGPKVDTTQVESLLTALDNLRADQVLGYGEPGEEHGAKKPHLTVSVMSKNEQKKTIVLGSPFVKDGKQIGRYAWRVDRNVIYVIPARSVEALEGVKL